METRRSFAYVGTGLATAGMLAATTAGPALAVEGSTNLNAYRVSHTLGDNKPAVAADKGIILTDFERQSIIDEFVDYGVNDSIARALVEKYESGQLLDSMKSGMQPISTTSKDLGDVVEVIRTYSDGSIAVETTSNLEAAKKESITNSANETPQFRSVYGCKYSSGGNYASYWKNCTADVNLVVVRMGFLFDYQSIRDIGSKITGYRSYFHHIFGGSLSNFRFDRISNTQVRLSADFDVVFKGFPAGWTAWMQANVNGSTAYTTNN
ncbi:Uncharacterised protein [Arcanobacterium haemolyticum]|nr:Uncharacterised protein [Arcanobacterium haemolyticum]